MSYLRLQPTDIVVSADTVVTPCWTNNTASLTQFFTASTAGQNNEFFLSIYQVNPSTSSAEIQFSVAYGNKDGSGSTAFNSAVVYNTPSKVTYGQYRNLVYGDENTSFTFGNTSSRSEIFAINLARDKYKQALMPGSLTLKLGFSGSVLSLTDDSVNQTTVTYLDCGRAYNLVSGAAGVVATSYLSASIGNYGLVLPDIGTIILNVAAFSEPTASGGLGITTNTTSNTNGNNPALLYRTLISGSQFTLLSEEVVFSNYVFVRIPSQELNYTLNPSMISGSGDLVYNNFVQNPQTFPTTVGLYNDNNELLAVAKLSKPLAKDFTKEALIRVKLNW